MEGPLANLSNARSVRLSGPFSTEGSGASSAAGRKTMNSTGDRGVASGPAGAPVESTRGAGIAFPSASVSSRGSAVAEDGAGGGSARIAELCPEDKQKIATLIQQVVKVCVCAVWGSLALSRWASQLCVSVTASAPMSARAPCVARRVPATG
jgi:hypothetical protein